MAGRILASDLGLPRVLAIEGNKGAVITICSGENLPAFPEWFQKELEALVERLQQEAKEKT